MVEQRCPQPWCNAPALLLFNLVCSNPKCQNYDSSWHQELEAKPRYSHKTIGQHTFLGGFLHEGVYYDLYHSINPLDDTEWVEARYGDELSCYTGEELLFAGISDDKILQEAAKRWEERSME
jgi:hypothetical protein